MNDQVPSLPPKHGRASYLVQKKRTKSLITAKPIKNYGVVPQQDKQVLIVNNILFTNDSVCNKYSDFSKISFVSCQGDFMF